MSDLTREQVAVIEATIHFHKDKLGAHHYDNPRIVTRRVWQLPFDLPRLKWIQVHSAMAKRGYRPFRFEKCPRTANIYVVYVPAEYVHVLDKDEQQRKQVMTWAIDKLASQRVARDEAA